VNLAGVPGRTTTTLLLGPGGATISGTVVGPIGPVPGADVHIERLVGEASVATDIGTNAVGAFALPAVLGGRYRIRAFVPHPVDLAMTQPTIIFLANNESKILNLQVNPYTGVAITSAIAPNPPVVGEQTELVVQATVQSVDDKGVVRGQPISGAKVQLFGGGDWRLLTGNPSSTNTSGRAIFEMRCGSGGPQPLSAVVNDTDNQPLNIPACVEPPPTPTTTATTTPPGPASTTTSTPLFGTTTTSTTRRPASTTSTTKKG
jgi:hypothetical protein